MRREAAALLPPAVLARLAGMVLGNAAVTELDHLVGRERLDPFVAARRWMDAHPDATSA